MGIMKAKQPERIWTKSFISVSLAQFIMFIVFYALLTTLPIYVVKTLGKSQADAGLIVSFMLISAIIVRPFSAKILDIIGKKQGLVLSVITFSLTTVFYLFVNEFIPLLVLRFIHGISFAVVTTATGAIVADIIPRGRRGAGMGYFALASNLAMVIGPFLGLTLLQFISFHSLFAVLNGLIIFAVMCAFIVKVPERVEDAIVSNRFQWADLLEIKALPVAVIGGLIGFVYASILSFVSVYADDSGLSAASSYFFLVFAIVMISFRPFFGKVFDEKGARIVLLPCLFIFSMGLVLLGISTTASLLLISAGLIGLGYGTLIPGLQTLAIQSVALTRSSYAIATFYVLFDIGIASGAYIWGLMITISSFEKMYFMNAIFVLLIAVIFNIYMSHFKKKEGNTEVIEA